MTKKQSWTVFWLLFLLYMFDYMDRMVIVSYTFFKLRDCSYMIICGKNDANYSVISIFNFANLLTHNFEHETYIFQLTEIQQFVISSQKQSLFIYRKFRCKKVVPVYKG